MSDSDKLWDCLCCAGEDHAIYRNVEEVGYDA